MTPDLRWILKALLSHYWRHPWQTLFLLVGLVSGVGLWSAVQIINQHAEASYRDAQNLLGVQASHWVQQRRDEGIDPALYIELRRAGFRQLFPLIELQVSTPAGALISVIATDLMAIPQESFDNNLLAGDFATNWLAFVQPPYQAWVPKILADELGITQGDQLKLRDGNQLPPALIQAREQQGRQVLLDIGAAMALSGSTRFSYLAVGKIKPAELERLRQALPADLQLVENQQHLDVQQLTESLHTHLAAMSLLSFAVGLFIVFNAVRFSLWYRRATLLDLRLMGCDQRQLTVAIVMETLAWSLLGSLLGFALGIVVAYALLPGLGSSLQNLYDATIAGELSLSPVTFLQAWAITLAGLVWALFWPLVRQLRRTVLQAAGSDAQHHEESRVWRWLANAALVLAVLAWFGYAQIHTAAHGFVVLGLILFAAAWLLPLMLVAVLYLLDRCLPRRLLLTRWMVSDGWAQLPAFRGAMMALLLALTANLGVGTLVDSFRDAFVDWLELRQSADIYLRSPNLDYARLHEAGQAENWLADSHHRVGVTVRWRGSPALIRGLDTRAPDSRELPLSRWQGSSPADALRVWRERGSSVLINEQLHFLAGVEVGDLVELETDLGMREYEVVGVFYDYGNPYFQFYLPIEAVTSQWQYYYSRGVGLWLNPDNKFAMQQAETRIAALGAQPGDWISQAEVRRLSVSIFDKTFAVTAAMNVLSMLVAAIALLASLLAILQERLPQFAQWRALGVRQGEFMWLIATPLLLFCAVVWLFSMPLGALLSWILIHKVNIVSFGWSMPLQWSFAPAADLALIVLLMCGAALLLVSVQWRRQMSRALARLGELV